MSGANEGGSELETCEALGDRSLCDISTLSPVTVSDINGLFFLFFLNKIYSKTGI